MDLVDVETAPAFFDTMPDEFSHWQHSFVLSPQNPSVIDVHGDIDPHAAVEVLSDCYLQRRGSVISDARLMPMHDVMAMFPPVVATGLPPPRRMPPTQCRRTPKSYLFGSSCHG